MADSQGMYMSESSAELVHIQEDTYQRYVLTTFGVDFAHTVHSFRDEFKDQVEVEVLHASFTVGIKAVLELDHIRMGDLPHDLQLTVLKSLVLQYLLDRHRLARFDHFGFEDDSKRAIPYDTFRRVRYRMILLLLLLRVGPVVRHCLILSTLPINPRPLVPVGPRARVLEPKANTGGGGMGERRRAQSVFDRDREVSIPILIFLNSLLLFGVVVVVVVWQRDFEWKRAFEKNLN